MAQAASMAEEHTGKHKEGVGEFISKTRSELDKTTFPNRGDVERTVAIVIVSVLFFAAYLYVVDRIWAYLVDGIGWVVAKLFGI
ncbi:MAG TPA: preprotein translocase subunit SecE [Pyrinomonadaceae bacterium]